MKYNHYAAALLILLCLSCKKEQVIIVRDAVWSKAPHNAFTDLCYYQGKYYCAFREAKTHVSFDGKLRVLTSADGNTWLDFAQLTYSSCDLRDPHFRIEKGNVLSLSSFARNKNGQYNNVVFNLKDNKFSTAAVLSVDSDFWLWSYMTFLDRNYSIGYNVSKKNLKPSLIFYGNDHDALDKYDIVNDSLIDIGCPTEAALCIGADSVAYTIVRDDCTGAKCFLGISKYPFAIWSWKELPFFVRGPNIKILDNGKLFLAASAMKQWNKTCYTILDPKTLAFDDIQELVSDGDNGYPGVVIHNNQAVISYYSSHEGKACIYIKKVNL